MLDHRFQDSLLRLGEILGVCNHSVAYCTTWKLFLHGIQNISIHIYIFVWLLVNNPALRIHNIALVLNYISMCSDYSVQSNTAKYKELFDYMPVSLGNKGYRTFSRTHIIVFLGFPFQFCVVYDTIYPDTINSLTTRNLMGRITTLGSKQKYQNFAYMYRFSWVKIAAYWLKLHWNCFQKYAIRFDLDTGWIQTISIHCLHHYVCCPRPTVKLNHPLTSDAVNRKNG